MPDSPHRVPLAGSERTPLAGARRLGPVDPQTPVRVSVVLRRRTDEDAYAHAHAHADAHAHAAPAERSYLSRGELALRFGAAEDDLAAVERFAAQAGLTVEQSDAAQRTVVLSGPAEAINRAFDVQLADYEHPEVGRYRGREGTVDLPPELAGVVTAVLGLDDRPQARPRLRRAEPVAGVAAPRATSGFTPPQVAQLYDFPAGTGRGQCIAIVSLGGGIAQADVDDYFAGLGIAAPAIATVSVGGAPIGPGGGAADADGENALDVQVSGSIAPDASLVVYFASNTTDGFLGAINAAIHDAIHKPSVISISWGAPEAAWTPQAMNAMDDAFVDAGLLGISVFVAAGDNGSADGIHDSRPHIDHPACSPHVIACGGTRLVANGSSIGEETVWNDGREGATGGGVSGQFALPSWQSAAAVPAPPTGAGDGRGVPDVGGNADPATGYRVRLGGQDLVFGGTSAVSPLWAALTAILNERMGHRAGSLNAILYGTAASSTFNDVVRGGNALPGTPGYQARSGWDACTGLGTPNGRALLAALVDGAGAARA
jgi:kumamolisin